MGGSPVGSSPTGLFAGPLVPLPTLDRVMVRRVDYDPTRQDAVELEEQRRKALSARLNELHLGRLHAQMQTPEGRAFCYRMVELSDVVPRNAFRGEATHETAFELGRSQWGHETLATIFRHWPELWALAVAEARQEREELNARIRERHPDPDAGD